MSCIKLISYTGNLYQLFWVFILWTPFIFTLYNTGHIKQLYNQLTWWSWSIQCLFYTYMHFKRSIFYIKVRSCCKKRCTKLNIRKLLPMNTEMYIFGIVSGITWFVFFEFMYILYYNPSLVYNESSAYLNKGIPQIGNIFIHYYIVAATPIWTIFNFRYLHIKLKTFKIKEITIFSTVWIIYMFIYISYWKFNIHGILKNYHIDDVSTKQNISYMIGIIILVTNVNAIFIYSIKKDLNLVIKKQIDSNRKIISNDNCNYENTMRDNINIIIPEN